MMILPYAMVYPSSQILIGDGDHYCVYHIILVMMGLYIYIMKLMKPYIVMVFNS